MDDYALGFIVVGSLRQQDKLAARLGGHRQDALHPQVVVEGILAPCQTFVRAVHDVIRGFLIVDKHNDRARVTVFPQVSVLVNLFPRLASISREENVTVIVWQQRFTNIADSNHEAGHRGTTVGGLGITSLGVAVDMETAVL